MRKRLTHWVVRLLLNALLTGHKRAIFDQAWNYSQGRFQSVSTQRYFISLAIQDATDPPHYQPDIDLAFACRVYLHETTNVDTSGF